VSCDSIGIVGEGTLPAEVTAVSNALKSCKWQIFVWAHLQFASAQLSLASIAHVASASFEKGIQMCSWGPWEQGPLFAKSTNEPGLYYLR